MDRINLQTDNNGTRETREPRGWLKKLRLSTLIPSPDSKDKVSATSRELAHLLNKTIEAQIIPQLLVHHSNTLKKESAAYPHSTILADEVKYFAELLIHSSNDICLGYIQSLRQEGCSLNEIYLDLIAPAARRLGCYWELDEQSFTTVTLALGRIQRIMQELSSDFRNDESCQKSVGGKVLLFAMPNSQHTMGVFMLGEFFAQAGWNVSTVPNPSKEEILSTCSKESFDIVGISISYELQWDAMQDLITELRKVSANSQMSIMAGGALFNAKPEFIEKCPADICTLSATDAIIAAETILRSRA